MTTQQEFRFTDEEAAQLVALWLAMLNRAETAEHEMQALIEYISIPITVMLRSGFAHGIDKGVMLEGLMHYQKLLNDTILGHAENLMTGVVQGAINKDLH